MKQPQKISPFLLDALLTMSGGFMDAYSYLYRNHVFANAQTGNILLLGVSLSEQDYTKALHYFCPVIAFFIGIIISNMIHYSYKNQFQLRWKQIALLVEAVLLLMVCFVPQTYNLIANSMISMACGIQVECFRKIHNLPIATTMCIGDLRSGTQSLCRYFFEHDKEHLKHAFLYYGIILLFVIGAVIGSIIIGYLQSSAIAVSTVLLLVVFILMFFENENELPT